MLVTNPKEEEQKKAEAEGKRNLDDPSKLSAAPPPLQPRRESVAILPVTASPAKVTQPVKEEVKVVVEPEKKAEANKVEIKRESGGLGLSIVGGSDTPLVGRGTSLMSP